MQSEAPDLSKLMTLMARFWQMTLLTLLMLGFPPLTKAYLCHQVVSQSLKLPVLELTPTRHRIPQKELHVDKIREQMITVSTADRGAARLPKGLKDGVYLYLIDQSGQIYFLPRVLALQVDGPFLGSHLGLSRALRFQKGFQGFIGAGEIMIRDQAIFSVNNRSGSFRSSERHLAQAVALMKKMNLPFWEDVHIHHWQEASLSHEDAIDGAMYEISVRTDPSHRAQFFQMQKQLNQILRRYPTEELLNDFVDRLHIDFESRYLTSYLLSAWSKGKESDYWIFKTMSLRLGPNRFQQVLNGLELSQ